MTRQLLCLLCLISAAPLSAQPPPAPFKRPYVQFPIDKNVEDLVKQRLQFDKDLGPLKELVTKFLGGQGKFDGSLLGNIKNINLQDEKLKKAFQDWLQGDPKLRQDLRNWVEQTQKKETQPDLKKNLEALDTALKEEPAKFLDVKPAPTVEAARPKEDAMAKALEQGMQNAANSNFLKWLKDSPSWQNAIQELKLSMANPQAPNWRFGEFTSKLLVNNDKAWKLGEETLAKLRALPRPDLERLRPSALLPGAPDLPSFSDRSLSRMNSAAIWLLLLSAGLMVTWLLLRWTQRPHAAFHPRASLGPWPIRPEKVTTRAELVQAFDYLALLKLGLDARCWHHGIIASQWARSDPARALPAATLASIYEQARYTEGPTDLSALQRDQARQALLQLAEGA